jgi:hypothetical protein
MLDIKQVLQRYAIRTSNISFAVADTAVVVGEAPDPIQRAKRLFDDVLGVVAIDLSFDEPVYARIAAKKMIQLVAERNYEVEEIEVPKLLSEIIQYTDQYVQDPKNSHLWSQPDEDNPAPKAVHVVEGLDCKVVLTNAGKIKKGGKQVLAHELYVKYVLEAEVPLANQDFIVLLMKELDMTKPGATTYAYNERKAAKETS